MRLPIPISGEGFGPLPYSPPPPTRSFGLVRIVVIVWLLGGVTFFAWKWIPATPATAPSNSPKSPIAAISNEDLIRHMEAVDRMLAESTAMIRRMESQIDRTILSLERSDQLVEVQQLKKSMAAAAGARKEVEMSRQEFALVMNSIRKDNETK